MCRFGRVELRRARDRAVQAIRDPDRLRPDASSRIRTVVEKAGLVVTGLHWLLAKPAGPSLRTRTVALMIRRIELGAALGGNVLVHGSPKQRQIAPGEAHATARSRLVDALAPVAARAGVVDCIEPLSGHETALANTVAEAAAIVREIAHPHLRTMIDYGAAALTETEPVPALLDRWLPTGLVAQLEINDPNRRAPGQGALLFAPVAAALAWHDYTGTVAVEPFDYVPDGAGAAAFAAGYWRGVRETLA